MQLRTTETQRLRDSFGWLARKTKKALCLCASVVCLVSPAVATAQQLLDRVVARVNGTPIMLSDVNAALGFGIAVAPAGGDAVAAATVQLIDRQLMLGEVARFSPPEPDAAAIDAEVSRLTAAPGARLAAVMNATGVDEPGLRELARGTLLIQAYVNERFGITMQVSDQEIDQYYRGHPAEFTRNGVLMPFEEAQEVARTRAAELRRANTVAQWLRDLRARAEIQTPPRS